MLVEATGRAPVRERKIVRGVVSLNGRYPPALHPRRLSFKSPDSPAGAYSLVTRHSIALNTVHDAQAERPHLTKLKCRDFRHGSVLEI